ncbi:MAG: anaerobic ribonucleoside-triphosphate reductase activating protein [Candidatus Desulfofervidaceae bacterium]|nr:anaerobic ribonucleoside-triphosphate reductase activating protein [Candidatus Desulfofervidaceae bacterium]
MNIGGVTPLSTIDFPGYLAAVVYTQGCNFRCLYCHNMRLVECKERPLAQEEISVFLQTRRRLIDGIVITGGEPTLQKNLPDFCRLLKEMGFMVKLDTNGSAPLMLRLLIEKGLIDYIAMDIKAPWEKYKEIVQVDFPVDVIKDTFCLIKASGLPCEFRTTVHSALLSLADIEKIIHLVGPEYSFYLQIAGETPRYTVTNTYTKEDLEDFIKQFQGFKIGIR